MLRKTFLFCLLWMSFSIGARASSILPLDLNQIIAGAAVAFQGTCIGERSERDPQTGLIVTYSSFSVSDVLKGSVGVTHTIKQIGGQLGSEGYQVQGVPAFTPGQEYVVFLYGVSSAGFSSPVGLSQGQFVVRRSAGVPEISNGRDFNELLATLPPSSLQGTSVAGRHAQPTQLKHLNLDEFKQIVRQHGNGVVK